MSRQHLIVSYGGGTNSTAMLVGLFERGITPDAITFSDTGGEKPETYSHMKAVDNWLVKISFPAITKLGPVMPQQIKDGSLENECLRLGKLPAKAYGLSSCSAKWKMEPARRFDAQYAKTNKIELHQITRLIGFDADEHSRVERGKLKSAERFVQEEYPLYDWGWGRDECIAAIARVGLPQPGKSACFFCPSSKKHEILWLQKTHPDLMERALTIERRALAGDGPAPQTTGNGLGRNFAWADIIAADRAQLDIFANAPEMDCGCYDGD